MWRREFSVLDGLFTFNVFWETFGEIGIFFRTYDNNNYYVLKVNPTATGKTISVWKNSNGRMVKLIEKDFSFEVSSWYSFFLNLN